jgi:hypothetical protein
MLVKVLYLHSNILKKPVESTISGKITIIRKINISVTFAIAFSSISK